MCCRNAQSSGLSGSPYSSIQLAPARSLAVAAHVDERDRAEQRAELFRVAGQHVGDQQAAVGAALGGDVVGVRHAPLDKVRRDGGEIVLRDALALTHAGLVPARPELAAAADIGDDAGPAALQPELADLRAVIRAFGHLEAAVAVEVHPRRGVARRGADLHIRDALAVLGDRLVARDDEAAGVEQLRHPPEHDGAPDFRRTRSSSCISHRRHRILREQQGLAGRFPRKASSRPLATPTSGTPPSGRAARPRRRASALRSRREIVERRQHELAADPGVILERGPLAGLEQKRKLRRGPPSAASSGAASNAPAG